VTQLEFQWKYAAPLLSGLGRPDYGTKESWERLYEQAWGHLAQAGLTKVKSPLDLTRIKLRIAALGWIAMDFVAASQQCEYANPFYWWKWIESLGIEPLSALITSIDEPEMREVLSQHLDSSEIEIKEDENDGIFADDQELQEELPNKIVAVAAEYQRQLVVNALAKGFGGEPELFLALYLACRDIQTLISDKESELEDELFDLREQFEDELNWLNAESVTDECNKNIERLRNEIKCFESMLEHESLRETVIEELRNEAFDEPSIFADDEAHFERMNGFNWCMEGCPIENLGEG
jgi:hypothetical protein